MPTFSFMQRGRVEPGGQRESPTASVAGYTVIRARIDPNTVDYNDPNLMITVTLMASPDGVVWDRVCPVQIVGQSRTKDGLFPYAAIGNFDEHGNPVPFPVGTVAKVRYTHNLSKRIGLIGEAE